MNPYGLAEQTAPDGSPWPTVAKIAKGQLGDFLNFDIELILDHLLTGEDQRRAKAASHFLMVWGKWDTRADFAHLQACLAACRAAVRGGGVGVIDVYAKKWTTVERLARMSIDRFVVEDHIMVQIGGGFCVTAGLTEKFMREDVLMKVPDASYNDHATFLLNEVAHNVATGKRYDEDSLFRWRQNGHMCQLVFKRVPVEECTDLPSNVVLEAVDMTATISGGLLQGVGAGNDANMAILEFERAAPHALKLYGWPPKPLPGLDLSAPLSVLGIVPGSHDLQAAIAILGQPHAVVENTFYRWAFDHQNWKDTVYIQILLHPETGKVKQVSGNSFTLGASTVTDQHTFAQIQGFLGQPELSQQVILFPDDAPLRTDYMKLYANSALGFGSFALNLEIDDKGQFCIATLTFSEHEPQSVLQQLTPQFAQPLRVGYREVSALPGAMGDGNRLSEEIQIYLDFSDHIYGLIRDKCELKHPVWSSEDGVLKTQLAGAVFFLGRNPGKEEWSELPMSYQLMRPEFETIEAYMNLPEVRSEGEQYMEQLGVDHLCFACFHRAAITLKHENPDIPDKDMQIYLAMMMDTFYKNREKVKARAMEVLQGSVEFSQPVSGTSSDESVRLVELFAAAEDVHNQVVPQLNLSHPAWMSEDAIMEAKLAGCLVFLGKAPRGAEFDALNQPLQKIARDLQSMEDYTKLPDTRQYCESTAAQNNVSYFAFASFYYSVQVLSQKFGDIAEQELVTYMVVMARTCEGLRSEILAEVEEALAGS